MRGEFDAEGFFAALDAQRVARGLSWKDVAEQSGVSASTLTRLSQRKRPDVDSLAALVRWSGLSADDYLKSGTIAFGSPEPLSQISALLRKDKRLTKEGAVALEEMIKSAYARLRK